MWPLIVIAAVPVLALIAYTVHGRKRHLSPSSGPRIDPARRPNSALLLIDLQEDFTRATGRKGYDPAMVDGVISAVNTLVSMANEHGQPVISIRQTYRGWYTNLLVDLFYRGRGSHRSEGLDIDQRIDGDIDHDIVKARADAFREAELETVLERQQVGKLMIVGLDGNYCVKSTLQAAVNRGYQVTFSDAAILAVNPGAWQRTRSHFAALGAQEGSTGNTQADSDPRHRITATTTAKNTGPNKNSNNNDSNRDRNNDPRQSAGQNKSA